MNKKYIVNHFSLSLPEGSGRGNVGDLLRHLAKEIDKLDKDVEILDVTFHSEIDENGEGWPYFTVYYS